MSIVKSSIKICMFILLVIAVHHQVKGVIWENARSYGSYTEQKLQAIPPLKETAEKLMTFFLARGPGKLRRSKRQAPSWTRFFIYDVVFIIDSSSSISPREFNRAKRGLIHLINRAKPNTQYAGICYSNHAKVAFNFTKPNIAKSNIRMKVQHQQGMTNTQEALNKCRTQLLLNPASGIRRRSYKRVMIVTDGRSNLFKELTLWRSLQLKFMGVEIYVMAVGKHVHGIQELASIATTASAHMYRVKDFTSFVKVVKLIPSWQAMRDRYRKSELEDRHHFNVRFKNFI